MNSQYNYNNRPTNAQMKSQYNLQYGLNHIHGTLKSGWNSLTLLQKFVLLGIIALVIYFVIKLIQQQREWVAIKESQTEPLFLSDLEWDTGGKKIFIGNKSLVVPATKLPESASGFVGGNAAYTYNFWVFMNGNNPFVPGADGATGAANISDPNYDQKSNIMFFRGNKNYSGMNPVVGFGGNTNDKLLISIALLNNKLGEIDIENIPINEWVNITITVYDNVCNVFINGELERSTVLEHNAKAPSKAANLYIGAAVGKGFPGEMAYLQYYTKVLTPQQIQEYYNYYLKKINDFMNNFNQWALSGNLVPAVPTNLTCLPDVDSKDSSASGSNGDSIGGMISGLESDFSSALTRSRNTVNDEVNTIKNDVTSDYDEAKASVSDAASGTAASGTAASGTAASGTASWFKNW